MEKIHCVYWIHRRSHLGLDEGYVGVTTNLQNRLRQHQRDKRANAIVRKAYHKYDDDIAVNVITEGDEDYCYKVEGLLRPIEHMGWNIAAGGGKPVPRYGDHRKWTNEEKQKISEGRKGITSWNKGIPCSEETKGKLSAAFKGIKRGTPSAAHRERISEAKKGKSVPWSEKRRIAYLKKWEKIWQPE